MCGFISGHSILLLPLSFHLPLLVTSTVQSDCKGLLWFHFFLLLCFALNYTSEWNHPVFIFFRLIYFASHDPLQFPLVVANIRSRPFSQMWGDHFIVILIYISLVSRELQKFFHVPVGHLYAFFGEVHIQISAHILIDLFILLLVSCMSSL